MRTRLLAFSIVVCLLVSLSAMTQDRATISGVVVDLVQSAAARCHGRPCWSRATKGRYQRAGEFFFTGCGREVTK